MAPLRGGEIAARLRAARGYRGFTQAELAGELGISVETLSRIENGKTTVDSDRRRQIAELCGVPVAFVIEGFTLENPSLTEEVQDLRDQQASLERRLEMMQIAQREQDSLLGAVRVVVERLEAGQTPTGVPNDLQSEGS